MAYETLLSPCTVGALELKNRVVFAPTTMGLSPEARAERLVGVAHGGAALIVLGDVGVEPSFHGSGFDLVSPEGQDACRALVADLHRAGARVCAQIFAPDYDTQGFVRLMRDPATTHEQLTDFMYGHVGNFVTGLPLARLEQLVELFALRAGTARDVGFDMVQIHGDRLVGSMSSGLYNARDDRFGGDVGRRAAFGAAIVRAVRAEVGPAFPIDYKLTVRQPERGLGKGGPTVDELPVFVRELVAAGVDAFHVTGANHSHLEDTVPPRTHSELAGEGCFLNLVRAVRPLTDRPLCTVGKLRTPAFVEGVLAAGEAQLVGMSRQLLADADWVRKVAEGRVDEIRLCTWCNARCVGALRTHRDFGCVFDGKA